MLSPDPTLSLSEMLMFVMLITKFVQKRLITIKEVHLYSVTMFTLIATSSWRGYYMATVANVEGKKKNTMEGGGRQKKTSRDERKNDIVFYHLI